MNAIQPSDVIQPTTTLPHVSHSHHLPAPSPVPLPAELPALEPADLTQPVDITTSSTPETQINPTSFHHHFSRLKSVISILDESVTPDEILQTLVQLLQPILNMLPPPDSDSAINRPQMSDAPVEFHSPNSVLSPQSSVLISPPSALPATDPDIDLLEEELQLANDPKSHLDHLPEERQEKLFELLETQKGAAGKLPALLLKHWDLRTSETALRQLKKRYQAKLDAAEQARLQKEYNDLAGSNAPNHTQAAEKLLERRLIQVAQNPKSTPEEIQKIVNATTRFINCQTAKARLQFQQNKTSNGGDTALTKTPTPNPIPSC